MAVAGGDGWIVRIGVALRKTDSAEHFQIPAKKCSEKNPRELRMDSVQTDAASSDRVERKDRDASAGRPQADDHVASLAAGRRLDDDHRSARACDRHLDVIAR